MAGRIIDGKLAAAELQENIRKAVLDLSATGLVPGLAVVLAGDDPASLSYVTSKERTCERLGMASRDIRLPASVTTEELLALVDSLNSDPSIHGILIQLPLPAHVNEDLVLDRVDPRKDVDGFHPVSVGRMLLGQDTFLPCTPHGVLQLLKREGISPEGRHVVVVGRSRIVGRPLANLLSLTGPTGNATVTICHSRTKDLAEWVGRADILIAALGKAQYIQGSWIKKGAVVIDVGVNRIEDNTNPRGYRLVGDVDHDSARGRALAITPVPGGVGPMTITMLMYNTLKAACRLEGRSFPLENL